MLAFNAAHMNCGRRAAYTHSREREAVRKFAQPAFTPIAGLRRAQGNNQVWRRASVFRRILDIDQRVDAIAGDQRADQNVQQQDNSDIHVHPLRYFGA
jgi:hypothetical protein